MPTQPANMVDLQNNPAGDLTFDDLFGVEAESIVPASQGQPQAAPATADEPFIKTDSGTVYKTKEDAIQGTVHKDQTIEKLRREIAELKGSDPLTGKPAGAPQPPISYMQNQDRFFDDLKTAVDKNDKQAYFNTLTKLMGDYLSPVAPVIENFTKVHATEMAKKEAPDLPGFLQSEEYRQILETRPLLRQLIQQAEATYNVQYLPELYETAYFYSQGRRVPELVKNSTPNPTPTARPSMSATTPNPPAVASTPEASDVLRDPEARKSFMERQRQLGVLNIKF